MTENQREIEQSLHIIRTMVEQTRKSSLYLWRYLTLWGWLIVTALIAHHILMTIKAFNHIWLVWVMMNVLGIPAHISLVMKYKRDHRVITYSYRALQALGFGAGIAFFLVGMILPWLKVIHFGAIPPLVGVLAGLVSLVMGVILEFNYLKWMGLCWYLGVMIMVFIPWHLRSLVMVPLIFSGYIIPGILLKKAEKDGAHDQ